MLTSDERPRLFGGMHPAFEIPVLLAFLVTAFAALMYDLKLRAYGHPKPFLLSWAAWAVPSALLGVTMFGPNDTWLAVAVISAGFAVLLYPGIRLMLFLRQYRYTDLFEAEHLAERERLKYRAKDFGGVALRPATAEPPEAQPVASAAPPIRIVMQPRDSVLAEVVADRRPHWATMAEGLVMVVVAMMLLGMMVFGSVTRSWDGRSSEGAAGAVAAALEASGHGAPRVTETYLNRHCPSQNIAFDWVAMGAQGRACIDPRDGRIGIKVDDLGRGRRQEAVP